MLEISTPALVFPALSVLMLAYTNKFIAISKRVRALHAEHQKNPTTSIHKQISSLRRRMIYIRNMQICALTGFSVNILCIASIFIGLNKLPILLFAVGLSFVFASLVLCIIEISLSAYTMNALLEEDMKDSH